ncbi:uncharacterized protein ARMOST_19121 [Armillaria ostoyae]|uniref:Uncharacterized protein n=1 Tax=Armillaria ostoyae TaxID=47428 RepID=A0A284S3N4_ARMOS|nr:uncharacterized protein ARMOST_19121 [Armillaria ostoyae]
MSNTQTSPLESGSILEHSSMPCHWKFLFENVATLPERLQEKDFVPVWLLNSLGKDYPFVEGAHFRVVAGQFEEEKPVPLLLQVERVEADGDTVADLLAKCRPHQLIG